MKLKVLKNVPGYVAGKTVTVETKDGIPTSRFWRERLRDAKFDKCVLVINPQLKSTPKKVKANDTD